MQGRMPWLLHQGGDAGWGDWSTVLPPMHLSAQFAVCEGADFQRNSILSEGKTFIEAPVLPKKLQQRGFFFVHSGPFCIEKKNVGSESAPHIN
eukprot:scaffold305893_cov19-Tisochrysis_lutea.AAC.2